MQIQPFNCFVHPLWCCRCAFVVEFAQAHDRKLMRAPERAMNLLLQTGEPLRTGPDRTAQ